MSKKHCCGCIKELVSVHEKQARQLLNLADNARRYGYPQSRVDYMKRYDDVIQELTKIRKHEIDKCCD